MASTNPTTKKCQITKPDGKHADPAETVRVYRKVQIEPISFL